MNEVIRGSDRLTVVVVAFIYFLCGSFSVFGLKVSLRPLIGHNAYFELKALYITCNIRFF